MAKKKYEAEKIEEEKLEEKIIEEKVEENIEIISNALKIRFEDFVDEYNVTKGSNNSYAFGFKTWYTLHQKKSLGVRMSFDEWKIEFEKYLSTPVK